MIKVVKILFFSSLLFMLYPVLTAFWKEQKLGKSARTPSAMQLLGFEHPPVDIDLLGSMMEDGAVDLRKARQIT